jgi:hypothetical protein
LVATEVLGLLIAAAVVASPPIEPTSSLTPGVTQDVPLATLCQPGYTAQPGVRHVGHKLKEEAFARYGIDPKIGGPYEIDHLISLELGGANDIGNLWPQSYVTTPWNAHVKDALEDRLHALVCAGKMPLSEAQHAIASGWIAAYTRFVATQGPMQ